MRNQTVSGLLLIDEQLYRASCEADEFGYELSFTQDFKISKKSR